MTTLSPPTDQERNAAKAPHNVFLWNLIGNHILTFVAIASMGGSYIRFLLIVPVLSIIALSYTLYRARKVPKQNNEFVWAHWMLARHWSRRFLGVVLFLLVVCTLGWLGQAYLGVRTETVYGLIGGLGLLPTLVMVLILIVVESDALNHASRGTLPKSFSNRF